MMAILVVAALAVLVAGAVGVYVEAQRSTLPESESGGLLLGLTWRVMYVGFLIGGVVSCVYGGQLVPKPENVANALDIVLGVLTNTAACGALCALCAGLGGLIGAVLYKSLRLAGMGR